MNYQNQALISLAQKYLSSGHEAIEVERREMALNSFYFQGITNPTEEMISRQVELVRLEMLKEMERACV